VEPDIDHRGNQLSPEFTIASATSESPLRAEASSSCPDKNLQKTSPLSTLLVYPKQKTKTQQAPKCARVLTSAESLAYLEEKQRKKKEEQEQKEQRKKEREMKKLQKEQEKIRKQQEKEAKKNQQKNKITKAAKRKRLVEESEPDTTKEATKRRRPDDRESNLQKSNEDGLQHHEISQNECAACFGAYEEDVDDDGNLTVEWIQCTNKSCNVWSHCNCLDNTEGEYICTICHTMFH